MSPEHAPLPARARHVALGLLLFVAVGQYAWNAWTVAPLSGYDAGGHAAYILTIVEDGRLPHPLEGWSTFHPPLYYLLGAGVWPLLEPLGPRMLGAGLRAISAGAILAAGCVTFLLAVRMRGDWPAAWVACAIVLFLPAAQLASVMVGNEALGAACAALALPWILRLQADPRQLRPALLAGLFAGLALATKYTGLFVAAACVVPFLRRDYDGQMLRALGLCALTGALVAGPVYARNLVLTGSPLPMTRELEPMKGIEHMFFVRDRWLRDYFRFPPACITRPSLAKISRDARGNPVGFDVNPKMLNVWCLAHASTWHDIYGQRWTWFDPRYLRFPPILTGLGLVPTGVVLLGFGLALAELVRRGGRSADAPIVVMSLVGLATFVAFTWRAPNVAAGKGSYLLPLLVPAGLFFVRGVARLPGAVRITVLSLSLLAALLAAVVFTNELLFSVHDPTAYLEAWKGFAGGLPFVYEAVERLTP